MNSKKPKFGPLTAAVMDKKAGAPPALVQEWNQALTEAGDTVIYSAGAIKTGRDTKPESWSSFLVCRTDTPDKQFIDEIDPDLWELLLNSAAHRQRLDILKQLATSPASSSSALTRATAMQGGTLYYHLRALEHAGLIEQKSKKYSISSLGLQFMLILGLLMHNLSFNQQGKLEHKDWIK